MLTGRGPPQWREGPDGGKLLHLTFTQARPSTRHSPAARRCTRADRRGTAITRGRSGCLHVPQTILALLVLVGIVTACFCSKRSAGSTGITAAMAPAARASQAGPLGVGLKALFPTTDAAGGEVELSREEIARAGAPVWRLR